MANTAVSALVDIKSAWLSKINWTQVVSGSAMILAWYTGGHLSLTPDQQSALVVTIGVIGNISTWVVKTWFTPTVSAASLPAPAVVPNVLVKSLVPGVADAYVPDATAKK